MLLVYCPHLASMYLQRYTRGEQARCTMFRLKTSYGISFIVRESCYL